MKTIFKFFWMICKTFPPLNLAALRVPLETLLAFNVVKLAPLIAGKAFSKSLASRFVRLDAFNAGKFPDSFVASSEL